MRQQIIRLKTKGEGDIVDLTPDIRRVVKDSGVISGIIHIFVLHSTAALTTIEYEKGVLSDLTRLLSTVAPDNIRYAHDNAWGDGNGKAHVKAALVGPSITVPIRDGEPVLGSWQQVVLLEFDIQKTRSRDVICTVIAG
jgi:secondary thiamine-phosphate synthase enzyme